MSKPDPMVIAGLVILAAWCAAIVVAIHFVWKYW